MADGSPDRFISRNTDRCNFGFGGNKQATGKIGAKIKVMFF
jgi:hypothetical protein